MKKDVIISKITPRAIVASYKDYFELNAGMIVLNNFAIVIDTLLYPSHARRIREYIEQNYNIPIKYLFLTHYHGDHVLGMGEFKNDTIEVFGAKPIIKNIKDRMKNAWSKESIEKWKEQEPENKEEYNSIEISLPDWSFEKSHIIKDGNLTVEFYHSGGHSSCSAWVYFPADKLIFTGDELASFNWPFISEPSGNPDSWIKAFEYMIALDVDIIVPGHGKLVEKAHLKEHLKYLKLLKKLVLEGINDQKSPEQLIVPDFYAPAEEWQIPKALEHLYNFYSQIY